MSEENNNGQERHRRILQGVVVSDKMEKTIVVQVTRRYRHPRYRKYVQERLRYKAHDENNDARMGDKVRITQTRPLSKQKRWRLSSIVERAPVL
jgi:small subunit ribosomal protein S17